MVKDSYGIDGDESFVGLLRISDTIVVFFLFLPRSISVCSGLLPTGNGPMLSRGAGVLQLSGPTGPTQTQNG
jgi:hypothetical protein